MDFLTSSPLKVASQHAVLFRIDLNSGFWPKFGSDGPYPIPVRGASRAYHSVFRRKRCNLMLG